MEAIKEALTFDDVLLLPRFSNILLTCRSHFEVCTQDGTGKNANGQYTKNVDDHRD